MIASMCRTNAEAAAAALDAGAVAATDITGFGLLGHLGQMAKASGVGVYLDTSAVPLLPRARELASRGYVPGGTQRNLAWIQDRLDAGMVSAVTLTLLADAQTSGGLVFGVEAGRAADVTRRLRSLGHDAAVIGYATHEHSQIRLG
jgi:selenide, water dikinase